MQLVLGSLELASELFHDSSLIILVEKSRILRPKGKVRNSKKKKKVAVEKEFRIAKEYFSHKRTLWNEFVSGI